MQKNTLSDLKMHLQKITIESYENAVRKSSLYNKEILKCNKKDQISSRAQKTSSCFLYHYKITVHSRRTEQWKMTGNPMLLLVPPLQRKVPCEICNTLPGPLGAHDEVHQQ